ncbi:STAS domain-containing protein [Nocardioides sp.]|uniref:STAS domain-containing protein n=1 Tax=Nocardioides sp. TaxID=35761 RepID=UPI00286D3538|nr:STAS domain-containing protein [Nocardioides sp.]
MIEFDVRTLESGVGAVTPRGRLNMVAARQLKDILTTLSSDGVHQIVVDLAETTFVDSSGLGALIGGVKSTRQMGGDLRIVRPTEPVLAVLQITNLDKILRPRDSVELAFHE